MRKVMQIFRIRKIGSLLLVLLALVAIFPVYFSVTGSLMGQKELNDLLGAVLTADSGSASGQAVSYVFWRVLPLYPTLRSYVKVLLDSPEFFVMFWNSVKITVGVLAGQILVGVPAAWGFARYRFPGKNLLFMIYVALMMMPFQVMMLSNYLVLDQMKLLDHLWGIILPAAFSTFPVFIMYRFFESIPEALMESARLDGAGELLIFIRIGIPLGSAGIISALVLGFLESDRTANGISEDQKSVAAVSVPSTDRYLPDRKGICGICSGSDPGSDRFSGRAGLSGTRDHIHGNQGIERQKREDLSMKKIKLIKILAGFFALMLLFTFLSRAADSVNVAQVETKTAQNQVITHEVTGTGKVMGTRERAVFTQEGQKVEQVYVQEGQNVKKGDALLKFSVKYLKKTIKEKQDAIDVLQGKINDLISAESVNQQKRNNEFSDAQENYNSAVSSGNYSVQAAQNEAAIARQKLQDYYAQRDAAQNDVQDKIPDEEKFSDSSEFDDPGNTDDFGNTDDPENSDDSGNTDRTDGEGNKNTSGNGDNSNAQDNSQEQALIDDIRAKEEAVNEAMLSRRRELQSAEQAIRDTQIGDASDSTLENTQAELETAQKDLETLQKVLVRKGKVKAPCDGVIKSLSAVTGSQTGAEAAVVLYESKGTFRFQAEVSKDDLKYIKSGGEVILKGADEKEITGAKVESVKEDSSNENQYILSVQVPEGTLSIGDTAEFTISQDAGPFNVCVPLSALYEENGRYYVYVTDTQNTVLGEVLVARKTYVNVKDKNSSTAALENGDLSSDQKIVISSDREISSGSRIRLLEE